MDNTNHKGQKITLKREGNFFVARIPADTRSAVAVVVEGVKGVYCSGWEVREGEIKAASLLVGQCQQ